MIPSYEINTQQIPVSELPWYIKQCRKYHFLTMEMLEKWYVSVVAEFVDDHMWKIYDTEAIFYKFVKCAVYAEILLNSNMLDEKKMYPHLN